MRRIQNSRNTFQQHLNAQQLERARASKFKKARLREMEAEIHPSGGGAAIPRAVGGAVKKAYDVLPVPETRAESHYRNQKQRYEAYKAGKLDVSKPIKKPRKP